MGTSLVQIWTIVRILHQIFPNFTFDFFFSERLELHDTEPARPHRADAGSLAPFSNDVRFRCCQTYFRLPHVVGFDSYATSLRISMHPDTSGLVCTPLDAGQHASGS